MSDIYAIGSSALLAYSNALATTSHNIANANTVGYSRQQVDIQARAGQLIDGNVIGKGAYVRTVQRLNDSYIFNQLVSDDASYYRADSMNTYASQLDSLLSTSSTGIGTPLQSFFTAVSGVASNPTSSAARQTLLGAANSLSAQFNDLQGQINGFNSQVDGQMSTQVQQLNGYATQLAQLNSTIVKAQLATPGQPPNDLLDQRDQLLRNISSITKATATTNGDGSMNVFIGNGQALVLNGTAGTLAVTADAYGRMRNLTLNGGGSSVDVTSQLSGGSLGGVMDFRREVLDPAAAQLGRIAVALSSAVNQQHAAGMDQYGQLGGDFFSTPTPSVTGALGNTGSATVSAAITDTNALQATSYELSYDGTQWTMKDASSGATVALSGSGTAADPFTAAGISLTISGTANAGDKYLVQPVSTAAGSISVAITDPSKIAAASPIQTSAASANTGSGAISSGSITDSSNANLLTPVTIQFTDANTYTINGAGSYTYTNGGDINVNGWSVQITGAPAAGDSFTVSPNNGSSSDNTNANLLAGVANLKLIANGQQTLTSANGTMVSQVGVQAQQASAQLDTETAIRSQDQAQRDSLSGVNLDEEAANLQHYQQAYQAAAQIIATANTMFQSLINALG